VPEDRWGADKGASLGRILDRGKRDYSKGNSPPREQDL